MQTYSVTGTYTYKSGEWTGTGQAPGALIDAADASEAAESYRASVVAAYRETGAGRLTETNVCAVSLTGPPEVHSDPLAGVPT